MSKPKGIFLIAQYFQKPKDGVNTSVKGWMDIPENVRWDEKVDISRGLKTKDMHAQVILNLSDRVVEKNAFNGTKDFDTIFRYFFTNYSQYITQVMAQLDPGYLSRMVDQMEAELAEEAPVEEPAVANEEAQTK